MPGHEPLPILVSRSIGAIGRSYAAAAPAGSPSLPLHAALLRFSSDPPFATRDLPARSRLSRRSAKVAVDVAARHGWVVTEPDPDRPRQKLVRVTPAGVDAATAATARRTAAEDRWSAVGGDPAALRRAAEALVGGLDLELPHHPIAYGGVDVTITGGAYADVPAGADPRIPPHGTDWRPVLRTDPASAVGLPISALLAQVLAQLTIDYERGGGVNLHAAIRVLRHIGDDGTPLADLDGEGISGDGRSLLERHGVIVVEGSPGSGGRLVQLTPTGVRLRDTYEPLVRQIESRWRDRHGDDVVDALRAELVARRDTWLPLDGRGATPDDHAVVGLTAKHAVLTGPTGPTPAG